MNQRIWLAVSVRCCGATKNLCDGPNHRRTPVDARRLPSYRAARSRAGRRPVRVHWTLPMSGRPREAQVTWAVSHFAETGPGKV